MAKSVEMHVIINDEDIKVGTCHPAKARLLVKDNRARWKGSRVYLINQAPAQPDSPPALVPVYEYLSQRDIYSASCLRLAEKILPDIEQTFSDLDIFTKGGGEVFFELKGPWLQSAIPVIDPILSDQDINPTLWVQKVYTLEVWGEGVNLVSSYIQTNTSDIVPTPALRISSEGTTSDQETFKVAFDTQECVWRGPAGDISPYSETPRLSRTLVGNEDNPLHLLTKELSFLHEYMHAPNETSYYQFRTA